MSETWVWNDVVSGDLSSTSIQFIADNNLYNSISASIHTMYGMDVTALYYDNERAYESQVGDFEFGKTITFLTKPTGDLLTYLQANAVKQSAGGIGLKNLSSYNQDLSIPRKKDLDAKQDIITGGASTITSSDLGSLRALVSDANGKVGTSSVTATQLGYLAGATSNVQTQLNNKVPTTRTVNNKALSSNITLTASDVSAIPNVPVTATNNFDMLMVLQGDWYTDHGETGIQNAASLIVNKWPDNVTIIVRSFRRWGKLCLFTVQIHVKTQITSDYGFTLLEMPYASVDRVWINNQTQFFMDANKVGVRVNEEKLFPDYYALTGFYLTTDNARAV